LPDDLTGSDWRHLNQQYLLQWELMSLWIDTRSHRLQDLVQKSQAYQADINRYYIDRLRYHKYRPNGGFLNFMFTDSQPGVSWSLVDYWRTPKSSYHAYREALAPQYAFCLTPKDHYRRERRYRLPLYVVNDAHHPVSLDILVRLVGPNGQTISEQAHHLTLSADCEAHTLGVLNFRPHEAGTWQLQLEWRCGELETQRNHYDMSVT
jgi:beta-mannosidase